jgi:hypothetical protein
LHARSVRPRHGAAAGAGAEDSAVQRIGAGGSLGNAGGGSDPSFGRTRARPRRLRQHSARAGAEGESIRPARGRA